MTALPPVGVASGPSPVAPFARTVPTVPRYGGSPHEQRSYGCGPWGHRGLVQGNREPSHIPLRTAKALGLRSLPVCVESVGGPSVRLSLTVVDPLGGASADVVLDADPESTVGDITGELAKHVGLSGSAQIIPIGAQRGMAA